MPKSARPSPRPPQAPQAPQPAKSSAALLPLGALAAGFGLMLPVQAQTVAPPAAAASAAGSSALPQIKVRAAAETDRDSVRAVTTTIGKGKQELRDIPQSVTVMTEKLLDDVKLNTLKEALHYTAGISFAATENGTDQDIRLRGFPIATTGDLLIDGMRDPSQYERDNFNLDRIEVMRGSASMLFGRGSTGGVVNQVTKKPRLVNESEIVGSVGSQGYFRGTGDFSVRLGETSALRINAMGNKSDNGGATIDKYGIAPSFGWGIGTPDEFNLGLFYIKVDNKPMSAVRWVNNTVPRVFEAGKFYGTTADYVKGEATYVNGSWNHRFGDGSELRSQFRSGVFDRAQWSTAVGPCGAALTAAGACPAGSPAVQQSQLSPSTILARSGLTPRKDRYEGTYVQSDYSKSFEGLGFRHELLTGFDAAHETAKRFQNNGFANVLGTRPPTRIGTPDDGAGLIGTGNSPLYRVSSHYSANAFGLYVQDLVQVTPQWKVLAGLRYDNFKGSFNQSPINNNTGVVTTSSADISESPFSYRAGLLYQPTPTASFHLSYGTSFNTSADTYQYVSPQTANTPPEKSRNIELGAKLDWLDNQLSTRVAVFRTEKYNERTTDSDFASTSFLLSGKRHAQGVEFDVVGRVTKALEVYLSASYIPQATIDKAGSTQANIIGSRVGLTPKASASAWVSYQATSQLRVAGGVHGASKNHPLAGGTGAAGPATAPGYVVGDAMVEYQFNPDVFAQFNVSNVSNKVYGDQLYPGFSIFGAPRTYQLSVGYRY